MREEKRNDGKSNISFVLLARKKRNKEELNHLDPHFGFPFPPNLGKNWGKHSFKKKKKKFAARKFDL